MAWLLVIIGLGASAPRVESELSGAGWQADGSGSVTARELAQEHFGGNASTAIQVVLHSTSGPVSEGPGKEVLAGARAILDRDPRIADIVEPQPGATLSKDRTTAVLIAGANADPNEMVRVADDLTDHSAVPMSVPGAAKPAVRLLWRPTTRTTPQLPSGSARRVERGGT